MSKTQNAEKLIAIFDALSDVSVTVIADFLGDAQCGGLPVSLRLSELGVTVLPVGVVGEDQSGQGVLKALHEHRVSTAGISKLKNYSTPHAGEEEFIHGEHPVLLNLIENARKLASASEAMFVCDHGIGAASPRVLNFIKSDGCVREKTLAARSRSRLTDFEQLSAAVASADEVEQAIGVSVGGDAKKLAVAGEGMVAEMKLQSFLQFNRGNVLAFSGAHKPTTIPWNGYAADGDIDVIGALFVAGLASGAETEDAARLAVHVGRFLTDRPTTTKRLRREEIIAALEQLNAGSRGR